MYVYCSLFFVMIYVVFYLQAPGVLRVDPHAAVALLQGQHGETPPPEIIFDKHI